MILVIDHEDSFVYNLARYIVQLGYAVQVVRHDQLTWPSILRLQPEKIVLSPGPCGPDKAKLSLQVVAELGDKVPILGVCLGHQVIAHALGGRVVRSAQPLHGQATPIVHDGRGLFADLPNPLTVGRYHSLVVAADSLPATLRVTARSEQGDVMALQHQVHPIYGVQFHPESVLTTGGYDLLRLFLRL